MLRVLFERNMGRCDVEAMSECLVNNGFLQNQDDTLVAMEEPRAHTKNVRVPKVGRSRPQGGDQSRKELLGRDENGD